MHYIFHRDLNPSERWREVSAMLARRNHKSAQSEQPQVGKLLAKDVLHRFSMPIPICVVERIPRAMVRPLGLAQLWSVSPEGERMNKFLLTQEHLSFSTDRSVEPPPINARVDMAAYV
jgi:hypothetical protein